MRETQGWNRNSRGKAQGQHRALYRVPREAAPTLEVFQARLGRAWSNLGQWKVSLLMAGVWNEMGFGIPPNPNHSWIL